MCCRVWRVTHVLLTLAAVGCCGWLLWRDTHRPAAEQSLLGPDPERPTFPADDALRSFLDVKSIGGDYQLPEGENFGVIALLLFEDGKFRGRRGAWQITGSSNGTRSVAYQLLWGRGTDGGTRLVCVTRTPNTTMTGTGRKEDAEFLAMRFEGFGTQPKPTEEVRGYRVLAHAISSEVREGQPGTFGRATVDINHRKTVAVVGVKTFPTFEQAHDCLVAKEPADP
jgi:hypothetical protein